LRSFSMVETALMEIEYKSKIYFTGESGNELKVCVSFLLEQLF